MSVHGEFQRCLDELVGFLQGCGTSEAQRWGALLRGAAGPEAPDLSTRSERVLELLDSPPRTPDFVTELQQEEFERLREHLGAICRVVLGR